MAETVIGGRQQLIPNCTLVPNVLLEGVMPRVSGGQWKALCYLCCLAMQWGQGSEDADLDEIAFATGIEEDDLEADLTELKHEGLVDSRITLPGDREVYWLAIGEEGS